MLEVEITPVRKASAIWEDDLKRGRKKWLRIQKMILIAMSP